MKNENQPQHTQGEWKTGTQPFGNRENCIQTISGKTLAICQHDTKGIVSEEEAEANAQRIVKAVNMHDELVEAISNFLSEHDITIGGIDKSPSMETIERFRQLLKQAEQK